MDLSPLERFRGRRVLVTGDTGFKGSWLCAWLHELGAEVSGFALPALDPSHYRCCHVEEYVDHQDGDLREPATLQRAFTHAQPEVVFHLAAQPLVRLSYEEPAETFHVNVGGTVNVLEQVRVCSSVRAVVIVTSDKCYENREWTYAYRENDPLGGHDPYSASKGCAELVTAAYRGSFFNGQDGRPAVATARAGNVIGGGDWCRDRLIPDCVRAVAADLPVVIRNPRSVRPWQHVLDPLSGYLLLASKLLEHGADYAQAWNFGPAAFRDIEVGSLAEMFLEAWGRGQLQLGNEDGPHEARLLRLSPEKTAVRLGWHCVLDASEAVRWAAQWYAAWHRGTADLRDLTKRQIRDYVSLAMDR